MSVSVENLREEVRIFNEKMASMANSTPFNGEKLGRLIDLLGQNWSSTHSVEVMGRVRNLYEDICAYGEAFNSAHKDYVESRIVFSTREEEKTGLF